jgi:stage V sporulation protein D (sporulation-specific penicillin-binding protein)
MKSSSRISSIVIVYFVTAAIIIARLFYWQVLNASELASIAAAQRESVVELLPARGNILASDGFPLAINQDGVLVYANPKKLALEPRLLADLLTPVLVPGIDEVKIATDATLEDIKDIQDSLKENTNKYLSSQLSRDELFWVLLKRKLSPEKKERIVELGIDGLGFDPATIRVYPEASMAAHMLGFIGQDENSRDIGYFGLEGYYELDLSGRIGIVKQEKDAINQPIPIGKFWSQKKRDGRHLQLYLDRSIQFLVEEELKAAVEKYEAESGSVVIMNPKTGGILAMASWPTFEPSRYYKYESQDFVNPVVAQVYEPGSTFKVLTMAAALEENVIQPSTRCDICDQPLKVDKYYIRTWNNKYYKDSTMTEVLSHSDNVGMVFVARKLGKDLLPKYIEDFGIGETTGIDLQGEVAPPLRQNWGEVDLYTAAFGQGLVVTPIQMVAAVGL